MGEEKKNVGLGGGGGGDCLLFFFFFYCFFISILPKDVWKIDSYSLLKI